MTQAMHRSDQILQATISDELHLAPSVDSNPVVSVRDGIVTLTGEVASVRERFAATEAAGRVLGVKAVADQLVVRSAGATGGTDADLARTAAALLNASVDVPLGAVSVAVHHHTIILSGTVARHVQREAAVRAVSNIRGATAVANNVTIRETATVSAGDGIEASTSDA